MLADRVEILAPDGHGRARDRDVRVDEVLLHVLRVRAIVGQRAAHGARAPVCAHVRVERIGGDRVRVVAPVGEEVAQPFGFLAGDQRLGQVRHLVEQEEPVRARRLRAHVLRDDARRHVVHHDEPVDAFGEVLREARRDTRAAIVADERDAADAERIEQPGQVARHVALVVAGGRLVGFAVAAQVGGDHAVAPRQRRDLEAPRKAGFREAVQQHDDRPAAGIDVVLADAVGGDGVMRDRRCVAGHGVVPVRFGARAAGGGRTCRSRIGEAIGAPDKLF